MSREQTILLRGANIWYLAEGMLGPLFAVFSERIGGDIFNITWAWATYLVAVGVVTIIVGRLVGGKKVEKRVMIAGYALNALFTFGYLLVASPWHLFVVQLGLGVANALATPTWESLFSRYEERTKGGYFWALAEGQSSIITGAAIIIGGFIVSRFSFRVLFVTMGCVQVLATVYQAKVLQRLSS